MISLPLISGVQPRGWPRAASKVTLWHFDGSGLYANVQIYIENVILKDIPQNPVRRVIRILRDQFQKMFLIRTSWAIPIGNLRCMLVRNAIPHPMVYIRKESRSKINPEIGSADLSVLTPENYIHICNDLHRYMGKGEEGDEQDIVTNTHAHKAQSLSFYENTARKR